MTTSATPTTVVGIGHGTLDLFLQFQGFFDIGRQAIEDGVEDAADLSCGNQVHVKLIEDAGMFFQGIGKGGPRLDTLLHRR